MPDQFIPASLVDSMTGLKHHEIMRAVPFVLSAVLALAATPAAARLAVCNKAERPANVALGRFNGTEWMSEGWWIISPNACVSLIGAPLDARYYYLYATDGAQGAWDGGKNFCTSTGKFTIVGRTRCSDRGFDRKGFFQIDTGEAPDFTQTLAD